MADIYNPRHLIRYMIRDLSNLRGLNAFLMEHSEMFDISKEEYEQLLEIQHHLRQASSMTFLMWEARKKQPL